MRHILLSLAMSYCNIEMKSKKKIHKILSKNKYFAPQVYNLTDLCKILVIYHFQYPISCTLKDPYKNQFSLYIYSPSSISSTSSIGTLAFIIFLNTFSVIWPAFAGSKVLKTDWREGPAACPATYWKTSRRVCWSGSSLLCLAMSCRNSLKEMEKAALSQLTLDTRYLAWGSDYLVSGLAIGTYIPLLQRASGLGISGGTGSLGYAEYRPGHGQTSVEEGRENINFLISYLKKSLQVIKFIFWYAEGLLKLFQVSLLLLRSAQLDYNGCSMCVCLKKVVSTTLKFPVPCILITVST